MCMLIRVWVRGTTIIKIRGGVWRYQSILLKPYKFKHEHNVRKQKFLATNYSFWRHSLGKMNTASTSRGVSNSKSQILLLGDDTVRKGLKQVKVVSLF